MTNPLFNDFLPFMEIMHSSFIFKGYRVRKKQFFSLLFFSQPSPHCSSVRCQSADLGPFPSPIKQHSFSLFTWFWKQRVGKYYEPFILHIYLEGCVVHWFHKMFLSLYKIVWVCSYVPYVLLYSYWILVFILTLVHLL